jgi:hypothetical protein
MIFTERERQRQRIIAHRHRIHPQHKPYGIDVVCMCCKKTKIRGEYMYFPASIDKTKTSHGLCKRCLGKLTKEFLKYQIEHKKGESK